MKQSRVAGCGGGPENNQPMQCGMWWWLVATYEGLRHYEGWHRKSLKKSRVASGWNNQGWPDAVVVWKTINQCNAEMQSQPMKNCAHYEGWHQKLLKKVEKKEMIKGGILWRVVLLWRVVPEVIEKVKGGIGMKQSRVVHKTINQCHVEMQLQPMKGCTGYEGWHQKLWKRRKWSRVASRWCNEGWHPDCNEGWHPEVMDKTNQSTNAMQKCSGQSLWRVVLLWREKTKKWKRRKQSRVSSGCGGGLVSQKKKERKQSTNPKKLRVAWKKSLQNKEKIYQLWHPKDVDNNQPMQKKETI